jgi:hypothetical protein
MMKSNKNLKSPKMLSGIFPRILSPAFAGLCMEGLPYLRGRVENDL